VFEEGEKGFAVGTGMKALAPVAGKNGRAYSVVFERVI
jgi:hypothetical protein